MCPPWVKKEREREKKKKRVPSWFRWFQFCAGVSNIGSNERKAWCILSCLLQTYSRLSTNETLPVSWQFSKTQDHWPEEGCCKTVLGVWFAVSPQGHFVQTHHLPPSFSFLSLFFSLSDYFFFSKCTYHNVVCVVLKSLYRRCSRSIFYTDCWIIFCPIKSYTCCF